MGSKEIVAALKAQGLTPREAARRLGLDEALLSRENLMTTTRPTKLASRTLAVLLNGTAPLLAMDAKVDLMPVVRDLSTKNFSAKAVVERLRKAIAGKTIAKDAGLEHVEGALKTMESPSADVRKSYDESVSPEQHNAMEAAAHGHSNLDIPRAVGQEFVDADRRAGDHDPTANLGSFLQDRGMYADDIKRALDMLPRHHAMDVHHYHAMDRVKGRDESPEEKAEREKREKSAEDRHPGAKDAKHRHHYANDEESEEERKKREAEAEDRRRADDAARAARDKMVTKDELSAEIKKARDDERRNQNEIRVALDEARPLIGDLRPDMAFDSADDVRRHVLKAKGKNVDGVNSAGLKAMVGMLPRGEERGGGETRRGALAMDSASRESFGKRFTDAARLRKAG